MPTSEASGSTRRRSVASLVGVGAISLVLVVVLLGLGTWQVYRRAWKLDLIARVDARIHAPPSAPPGPDAWSNVTAAGDEYRHVAVTGIFLNGEETLVQAVTDYGPGYWILTPLKSAAGFTVLINRGFVPSQLRDTVKRPESEIGGETTVTGLLRVTEPGGAFLRHNDPVADRWYSRDVAAIAARRGLSGAAPYFIDADGPTVPGHTPIGGLTVVSFPNNHLVYAITWYALGLMLGGAVIKVGRDEWRRGRGAAR